MDQPRDRLIAAARTLFASKGFHSSPMSELAAVAGVSVGQIYRLFPGKEAIIRAIAEHDVRADFHALESISAQVEAGAMTGEQALEAYALFALRRTDDGLVYEILAEAYRNPAVREIIGEVAVGFRHHVRHLVRVARPAFDEARLMAGEELLLSFQLGIGGREFAGSNLPPEDLARQFGRMLMGGLKALE